MEGIGQCESLPAIKQIFRHLEIEDLDPLRLLFVAIELHDDRNHPGTLRHLFWLNDRLRHFGIGYEKVITARVRDYNE